LVAELLPTMFTDSAPAELVEEFAATLREFHPVGIRANSRAFADADLRDVLPHVAVPTPLLCGDRDVRAPLNVARDLHAKIRGSRLVVISGAITCATSTPRSASTPRCARSFAPLPRNSWNSHLWPVIVV
jgi:pimeloyl-ACP methyl ester carboxylesterase